MALKITQCRLYNMKACIEEESNVSHSIILILFVDFTKTLVIYANGQAVQESSQVVSRRVSENSKYIYIGHSEFEASSYVYDMMVDDYAIYCKALSAYNIAFLYNLS